jgi:S1-C subfamily serine protease
VVKGVIPGSRAARAGFRPGDVLVTAGGHEITSGLDLHKAAFPAAQKDQDLSFQVRREGKNQRIVVQFQ